MITKRYLSFLDWANPLAVLLNRRRAVTPSSYWVKSSGLIGVLLVHLVDLISRIQLWVSILARSIHKPAAVVQTLKSI